MIAIVNLSLCLDEVFVVDTLVPGSVYGGMDPVAYAGGKGPNVARALASLGVRSRLFGSAGGETGRRIAAALERDRIRADLVPASGESRRCLILVERRRARQTVLNGTAPSISTRSLERLLARLDKALASGARGLVLTGSLPRGCPHAFYSQVLERARRAGVPSLLDSSSDGLRAGLSGRVRPAVLKINRRELRALLRGGEPSRGAEPSLESTIAAVERARRRFRLNEVVVTGGAGEVVACYPGARLVAHPPRVRCLNAVGSGDAFAGGYMVSVGGPFPERLALAVAAGTASCEILEPRILDRSRVEALQRRVRIDHLSR
jgi:tagatose 6-phosphate kinase